MDDHMKFLVDIAAGDVRHLEEKERSYGGSWKKRGGVGAFMMLARKWDRLETMLGTNDDSGINPNQPKQKYDIFEHIEVTSGSGDDGMPLAEVRDLRRYLLLVEAEMMARGVVALPPVAPVPNIILSYDGAQQRYAPGPGTPEDGGQHARMTYYEDGHTIAPAYAHLKVVSPGGVTYYLADRTVLPRHSWDHLPRLAIKMNFAEWNALMGCYQALYHLKEDNNYLMLIKYRELWGTDQPS